MRRVLFLAIFLYSGFLVLSQDIKRNSASVIAGNLLDSSNSKAIANASVQLTLIGSDKKVTHVSDKNGEFSFTDLSFGYYRLNISYVGYASLRIDSINVRAERSDFNLA